VSNLIKYENIIIEEIAEAENSQAMLKTRKESNT